MLFSGHTKSRGEKGVYFCVYRETSSHDPKNSPTALPDKPVPVGGDCVVVEVDGCDMMMMIQHVDVRDSHIRNTNGDGGGGRGGVGGGGVGGGVGGGGDGGADGGGEGGRDGGGDGGGGGGPSENGGGIRGDSEGGSERGSKGGSEGGCKGGGDGGGDGDGGGRNSLHLVEVMTTKFFYNNI